MKKKGLVTLLVAGVMTASAECQLSHSIYSNIMDRTLRRFGQGMMRIWESTMLLQDIKTNIQAGHGLMAIATISPIKTCVIKSRTERLRTDIPLMIRVAGRLMG